MRGGRTTGLAYAHTDTRKQQLNEVLRKPASCGHHRPKRQRPCDQPYSIALWPVGIAGYGNTQERVENGKGQPRHQADLGVAQFQVTADVLRKNVDDLPVEKIEDIDD